MIEEYCNKWGILPECLHIVECLEGNEHYTPMLEGMFTQLKRATILLYQMTCSPSLCVRLLMCSRIKR